MKPNRIDLIQLLHGNLNGKDHDEIVKLVGLNPHLLTEKDGDGRTPLQWLIKELIDYLPYADLDKNFLKNIFKHSAMILIRLGADPVEQPKREPNYTLLHCLIRRNTANENGQEITELLNLNINLANIKDSHGRTPLQAALLFNPNLSIKLIDRLLSPENLHMMDDLGATPLHDACKSGNLPAVQHFYAKGLSLTAKTKHHMSPIHLAVLSKNIDLLQWLLEQPEIDVNVKGQDGKTALHLAVERKNYDIAHLLIRYNADITIQDHFSRLAYEFAIDNDHHYMAISLLVPKDALLSFSQWMCRYGKYFVHHQYEYIGSMFIKIANQLTEITEAFFKVNPNLQGFDRFKTDFLVVLNSENEKLREYGVRWQKLHDYFTITLKDISQLLINKQLSHEKITEVPTFFQRSKIAHENTIKIEEEEQRQWCVLI